jgi:crotonobetainyl-CoA:carnitine CoA-transferase CaiB-like acyl-CoA transferase
MTGTEQPNQFPKDPLEDLPKELPKELPLAGVRVIEMTHMVMGPTCGMILAQLGAEVI